MFGHIGGVSANLKGGGQKFPMFFFWTLSFFQSFRHRGMFGHIRGKSVTQNRGLGEKFFRCFFFWTLSFFQSFRHRGMFGHIGGKSVTGAGWPEFGYRLNEKKRKNRMNRLLVPPRSVTGPATDLWDLEKKKLVKNNSCKKEGKIGQIGGRLPRIHSGPGWSTVFG